MEHEQKFKEYDFEPLGLPEQDGVWQVWGELDFTLTTFCWMGLFGIFYSLWYDILN